MSDSHYYLANRPQTTTDADCDIESGAQTATTATQPSNLQRPAKRLWSKATVLTLFFTQLLLSLLLLLYAIWCRLSLPLSSRNWSRAENNANILTITAVCFSRSIHLSPLRGEILGLNRFFCTGFIFASLGRY
jgi:hypothetical protein